MIIQTYDDWRRMLEACAAAGWGASEGRRMHDAAPYPGSDSWRGVVVQVLNGDSYAVAWRQAILDVARALGIDRRVRLEWRELSDLCADFAEAIVGDGVYATAWQNNDDGCGACTHPGLGCGDEQLLRVTGHPTRESAIEHLERLLASRCEG